MASASSTDPRASDACTMTGDATFGSTWVTRIRHGREPIDCDASMNVSSRTASVCARMSRVKLGMNTIVSAIIALVSPGPSTPAIASARINAGIDRIAVHDAHQRVVEPRPDVARRQPEWQRDDERGDHHLEARPERHAGTGEQTGHDVAPETVGAEPVVADGPAEDVREVGVGGAVGPPVLVGQGRDHEQDEIHQCDERRLLPEEPAHRSSRRSRGLAAHHFDRPADRGRLGVVGRALTGPRRVDRFGVDVALAHPTRTRGLK